jgi:hypothetical protein
MGHPNNLPDLTNQVTDLVKSYLSKKGFTYARLYREPRVGGVAGYSVKFENVRGDQVSLRACVTALNLKLAALNCKAYIVSNTFLLKKVSVSVKPLRT